MDNARVHHAADLTLPANVALLFQPPDAPELNPTERVWLAVKNDLAWRLFEDVLTLQDALAERIEGTRRQVSSIRRETSTQEVLEVAVAARAPGLRP